MSKLLDYLALQKLAFEENDKNEIWDKIKEKGGLVGNRDLDADLLMEVIKECIDEQLIKEMLEIANNQQPPDPEAAKILEDNLWDLVGDEVPKDKI